MNYKLSEIAAVVGGKFTGCDAEVRSVVTDSRSLSCELGCCPMFVAMRGANHDSHGFVAQMSARGVRAFLVERDVECPADCGFVRVDNAIDALQRLAAHYRAQFRGTVVGITGSNGKTVIKEWIAEELPAGMKYYRSPKSYNSQLGVPLSVLGMYLIASVSGEGFSLGRGDWLMLASALLFACHIVVVGHFAPQADGVALSCAQFFVAGLMTLPIAFLTEHIPLAGIWEAKWALLYAGVLSCGVAYTLQIVGQKDTPPAIASLTMSLESVFSAIAGAIILHETLQPREMLGCALMLAAVMIAQLPIGRQKKAA